MKQHLIRCQMYRPGHSAFACWIGWLRKTLRGTTSSLKSGKSLSYSRRALGSQEQVGACGAWMVDVDQGQFVQQESGSQTELAQGEMVEVSGGGDWLFFFFFLPTPNSKTPSLKLPRIWTLSLASIYPRRRHLSTILRSPLMVVLGPRPGEELHFLCEGAALILCRPVCHSPEPLC